MLEDVDEELVALLESLTTDVLESVDEELVALLESLTTDVLEIVGKEELGVVTVVAVELCVSMVELSAREPVVLPEVPPKVLLEVLSTDVLKAWEDQLSHSEDVMVLLLVTRVLEDDTEDVEDNENVGDVTTELELELIMSDEVLVLLSLAEVSDVKTGEDEDSDDDVLNVADVELLLSDEVPIMVLVAKEEIVGTDEEDDNDEDDEVIEAAVDRLL